MLLFFFFNDTATTEIYTLSLHDALPISAADRHATNDQSPLTRHQLDQPRVRHEDILQPCHPFRSEEHTSELQSQFHLVCRLLLEKKKKKTKYITFNII